MAEGRRLARLLRFIREILNGYSYVRCEAFAKGFGMPTQCRDCAQR